jgi:hypothetical protein
MPSMKGKTLLKGHSLLFEGRCLGVGKAICSCGQKSDNLPSNAARQRWHKEHKDAIIAKGQNSNGTEGN